MNRKKIYITTLILPSSIILIIILLRLIVNADLFWSDFIETITTDWYQIIGGISASILGIEIFGRNLEKKLQTKKRVWIGFIYTMKIFIFFSIANILTSLIEKSQYIDGIEDLLNKIILLILISLPVYLVLISITSLLIGIIIAKSKLGKN